MSSFVKQGHLHTSGFIFKGRSHVRAIAVVGGASAGLLVVWSSNVAPVAATYNRSGTTVTVDKVGHGLSTGDAIGINFEPDTAAIATPGNYVITKIDDDSFSLTDINSGTIANDPDCSYVYSVQDGQNAEWLLTHHTAATDIYINNIEIPDMGIMAKLGIYVTTENLASVNIYYS